MKRAQATLEYVIFFLLILTICVILTYAWNRNAIIYGTTFSAPSGGVVNVRPMTR